MYWLLVNNLKKKLYKKIKFSLCTVYLSYDVMYKTGCFLVWFVMFISLYLHVLPRCHDLLPMLMYMHELMMNIS